MLVLAFTNETTFIQKAFIFDWYLIRGTNDMKLSLDKSYKLFLGLIDTFVLVITNEKIFTPKFLWWLLCTFMHCPFN